MRTKTFRYALIITVLVLGSLACNLLNVGGQIQQIQGTAQAAVTEFRGLATEGRKLVGTAEAYATQNPGFIETAQAGVQEVVTQVPGLLSTGQAVVTEHPGAIETLQALTTEKPGAVETAQSSSGSSFSQVPADIPMPQQSQVQDLTVVGSVIYYNSTESFQNLVDLYTTQLPQNGWTKGNDVLNTSQAVSYIYTKGNKTANVSITYNPTSKSTAVVIAVTGQ